MAPLNQKIVSDSQAELQAANARTIRCARKRRRLALSRHRFSYVVINPELSLTDVYVTGVRGKPFDGFSMNCISVFLTKGIRESH